MGCNGSRPKLNDVFPPLLAEFFFGNCKDHHQEEEDKKIQSPTM